MNATPLPEATQNDISPSAECKCSAKWSLTDTIQVMGLALLGRKQCQQQKRDGPSQQTVDATGIHDRDQTEYLQNGSQRRDSTQ